MCGECQCPNKSNYYRPHDLVIRQHCVQFLILLLVGSINGLFFLIFIPNHELNHQVRAGVTTDKHTKTQRHTHAHSQACNLHMNYNVNTGSQTLHWPQTITINSDAIAIACKVISETEQSNQSICCSSLYVVNEKLTNWITYYQNI